MKLLFISTWLPQPPDNGSRVRAFQFLRHLARRHTITLLTFSESDALDELTGLRTLCDRLEVVPRIPLRDGLGIRGLLSSVPRYFVQTESARMKALVAAHIHQNDAAVALQVDAAVYLAGWPGVPRIFDEVEIGAYRDAALPDTPPWKRSRRRLTSWKFARFVRGLVNSFDRSTVVSNLEREHLVSIGCVAERIAIVPNGANAVHELASRPCDSGQLIYPGSVRYPANLDAVRYFVREVLPLVRRVRPDVTFSVTGSTDGVELDDLTAVPGVYFTGRLPEVGSAIARSAACVVPLRTGGGTRVKVLEAMALGTPVVSTSKGIEGLTVNAEEHVLVADEAGALAAQVLRLLGEPALATALSTNAHRLVRERFGWDGVSRTLEQVIEGAVAEHTSSSRPPDFSRAS